jgi:hypothetical protein
VKAHLLFPDRDFDFQAALPWNAPALAQDLELGVIWTAMAEGDKFLYEVAQRVMLHVTDEPHAIRYRQDILADCLRQPEIVREIYALAVEANEGKRQYYWGFSSRYPSSILHEAVSLLGFFVGMLRRLRKFADTYAEAFASAGFRTLFAMLQEELSDEYFAEVESHLKYLRFRDGALVSASLGRDNKGTSYVLRRAEGREPNWVARMLGTGPPAYSFALHPRDEAGARALSTLRDRGVNLVANAAAQSADHILSFFNLLRAELAFYVGCMNLHAALAKKGEPTCFPQPAPAGERKLSFRGLYDVSLALSLEGRVVGNDLSADGKDFGIVTGANRGGKSTFLRSLGLAHLMLQSGMFVGADSFSANVCTGVFTHYKREEDATMKSGKFDEEVGRMSEIADRVRPNGLLLFNESFAATNDREGSEIARQIVSALLERRIKVFFVTHLYEFARGLYEEKRAAGVFLRAERQPDGSRTFKLVVAEPLETSYGEDLYAEVFTRDGPRRSA